MKVHPGMLMKTQVAGYKWQAPGGGGWADRRGGTGDWKFENGDSRFQDCMGGKFGHCIAPAAGNVVRFAVKELAYEHRSGNSGPSAN